MHHHHQNQHHHTSPLSSYQRLRTVLIIACVLIVILQIYILSRVISHTVTVFEEDIEKTEKFASDSGSKLKKSKDAFLKSFAKNVKDDMEKNHHHHQVSDENVISSSNKRSQQDEEPTTTSTISTKPQQMESVEKPDDHHHHHDPQIDSAKLQEFLSSHPNIHTTPLLHHHHHRNRNLATAQHKNGRQQHDSMPPEAQQLLDLYSDIEPNTEDDEFIDEFLMKEKNIILRPETALLLKKVQTLNKMMRDSSRKSDDKKSGRRVVIVHPVGQLCNRLVSISSAFIFSILSKRALYVDFESDFYCQADDLFLKPGFDWTSSSGNNLAKEDMFHDPILENPEQGPWSMAEPLLCSNYTEKSSSSLSSLPNEKNHNHQQRGRNYNPWNQQQQQQQQLKSFEDHDHPTIIIRTNQYLVPYMQRNKFYRKALEFFFPPSSSFSMNNHHHQHDENSENPSQDEEDPNRFGGDVFHVMAHFLFRPLPKLLKERDEHMKLLNFKDFFVVGLQVRAGGDFTENQMKDKDWKLYADCGKAASFYEEEDEEDDDQKKKKKIKYYIATDTAAGRQKAKQALGASNVFFGPGEFLLSNHPRGVQMALLDLLLLEQANDRVSTAWSTFGYFAAGRAGVPSNLVTDQVPEDQVVASPSSRQIQRYMGIKHKSDKRKQCVRLPTVEPCFHHFENWGASKVSCAEENWLRDEMTGGRYC